MNKILCLVLFLSLLIPQSVVASSPTVADSRAKKEILDLRQQISQSLSNDTQLHEKYYKHKLAQQQVKLLKLTTTNFILKYHPRRGAKYAKQIKEFVDNSFESSFIFPTLAEDHLEVFLTYQRWAQAETGFDPQNISVWKKGQVIKRKVINPRNGKIISQKMQTLRYDSEDAGILQVNIHNLDYIKKPVANLYKEGVLPFKVKQIVKFTDLLDVNTNLVARSVIEADRKKRGWDYKHYSHVSVDFMKKLQVEVNNLKVQGMYDVNLVQNYYHLNPVKTYLGI